MFAALRYAASMITGAGSEESWHESTSSSPEHCQSQAARDQCNLYSQQVSAMQHGTVHSRDTLMPSTTGRPLWQETYNDAGFSEEPTYGNVPLPWMGSGNNRLFIQLMDDLDNLSSSDSVHRRRRARDMFSEWIFSADMRSPVVGSSAAAGPGLMRNDPLRHSSAAAYGPRRRSDVVARDEKALRRCSGDFSSISTTGSDTEFQAVRLREKTRHGDQDLTDRRRSVPPIMFLYDESEENGDCGYHSGPGYRTVLPRRPPGEWTLTRDDLRRRIAVFNANNHGLLMDPPDEDNTFHGFIRVHMNLIRPINMCISVEPPTLFDICASDQAATRSKDAQVTSFYLPKDTTKVIHISSCTTTAEVIRVLLSKYHITDNPRKFALYEKTSSECGRPVSRRMLDDELPLNICLSWTNDGLEQLDQNQFVLQENETGEILWEAFSLPELESFLLVLNREEDEYIKQVRTKYRLRKAHMKKRLQSIESGRDKLAAANRDGSNGSSDKRTPVFV